VKGDLTRNQPGMTLTRDATTADPDPSAHPASESPVRIAARRGPSTFSSLGTRNFRLFVSGQAVSNIGAWMQRIAQDWLVLSLTGSATDVGITTALQFAPTLMFGLTGGLIADRYPKRRILMITQVAMASMAATLATLTLIGQLQVWQVFAVAFGLGVITAVDNPTRQSFVNEMVGPDQLRNAISVNASVFQLGALVGPALSGVLINAVGPGYSFAINAISYVAPMIALSLIRERDLVHLPGRGIVGGQLRDGVRYVASRPAMRWPIVLVGCFGLFTMNLPVTLAAFANSVFDSGPGGYGLLSSVVAFGSLTGALASARRPRTRLRALAATAGVLAISEIIAAGAPTELTYTAALVPVGAATLMFLTAANSTVQLAAADAIRGRVMGVYLLVFIGSGAVGAPILGYIDQHLGPRAGMLLAGLAPATVLGLVCHRLALEAGLRLRWQRRGAHWVELVPR
jgi:MFS family permease